MEEIIYLILTILIELPVALLLLKGQDLRRVSLVVLGLNMVTHPVVWQLTQVYYVNWYIVEGSVALIEGLVLAGYFPQQRYLAFTTGIIMNIITAGIGLLIS